MALYQAVEGGGGGGHQPDADAGHAHMHPLGGSRPAGNGQHHANQRAKNNQLHHARLGQRIELADSRGVVQQGFTLTHAITLCALCLSRAARHFRSGGGNGISARHSQTPDHNRYQGRGSTSVKHGRNQGPVQDHVGQTRQNL